MILSTERLVLREFADADAPFILELLNDASFIRNIGDRGIRTLEDAREYIRKGPAASYAQNGFGLWLVALKQSRTPIGMCGLLQRDVLEDVDIGFAYLPAFRSRGYGFEAARAVLDHARGTLRLKRVVAIVNADNEPSARLLEKLGMSFARMAKPFADQPALRLFAADFAEPESAPESAEWRRLDPRKIDLDRVAGYIWTAISSFWWLFAATMVGLFSDDAPAWVRIGLVVLWLPFTVAVGLFSYRWPVLVYRHARYRIDDQLIEIETGVLWRRTIAVPRSRVQHLDVTQGPLQRRYGLGILSIYTAGTEHSQVALPGLAYEDAQSLRDRLLPQDRQLDGV